MVTECGDLGVGHGGANEKRSGRFYFSKRIEKIGTASSVGDKGQGSETLFLAVLTRNRRLVAIGCGND